MTKPVPAILLGGGASPAQLARMGEAADAGLPPTPEALPTAVAALVKRLTAAGVAVTLVADLEEAKAVAALRERAARLAAQGGDGVGTGVGMDDSGGVPGGAGGALVTPLLLDLTGSCSDDPEDLEAARRALGDCRHVFGGQGAIAITAGAPPRLLLECFRAGAADVIDLSHEGTAKIRAAMMRAATREQLRRDDDERARQQVELLEELVRDLVRSELRLFEREQPRELPSDARVVLERLRARHAPLLARYLQWRGGRRRGD